MAQEKKRIDGAGMPGTASPFMFTNAIPDMQKLMMVVPHMQAAFMKAAVDQQRELFTFLEHRCAEDMKLADRIGSASSVGDLYSAYLGFYKDAATQYAAQAGRVSEISSRETIEVVHDLEQQQAEAMAAVGEQIKAREEAPA